MADRGDIAVLVLAGGEGRRMGGGKAGRMLAGRRLLDRAIAAARRCGGAVAVGVRSPEQFADPRDIARVVDCEGIGGPLASLAAGLAWAASGGAGSLLAIPCDAPFLPRDLGVRLSMRARVSGATVAIPSSCGRLHPACGLWRVHALARLPAYLAGKGRSLIGFAEHLDYAVEDWGAPACDPFFNVNTPQDLAIAEAWLAQAHFE